MMMARKDIAAVVEKLDSMRIHGEVNSIHVLEAVLKTLEEDPKRLDMRRWGNQYTTEYDLEGRDRDRLPACGTVACVSGWGSVLLTGNLYLGTEGSQMCALLVTGDPNTPVEGMTRLQREAYYFLFHQVFVNRVILTEAGCGTPETVMAMIKISLSAFVETYYRLLLGVKINADALREKYAPYDAPEIKEFRRVQAEVKGGGDGAQV